MTDTLKVIYPRTMALIGQASWNRLLEQGISSDDPEEFPEALDRQVSSTGFPEYVVDLARLERAAFVAKNTAVKAPSEEGRISLNPSIQLVQASWQILPYFEEEKSCNPPPKAEEERILLWKHLETGTVKVRRANDEDLLVIKMVAEEIDAKMVADLGKIPLAAVKDALGRAAQEGLLLRPPSSVRRPDAWGSGAYRIPATFLSSDSFTLQWHVTQSCDLHCKHCYDRSVRECMPLEKAYAVLEDLDRFCNNRNVRGCISFTGGNPFLHPNFIPLYRRASECGFGLSILGNPVSQQQMEEVIAIRKPDHFQVSLEGLKDLNDSVRGPGHFDRTLQFLGILKDLGVYSMVMLTLTEENIDQVLPLAETLRDRTDVFHFNRLSLAGEGASLALPSRDRFMGFLEEYLVAAKTNPVLGMKENLLNVCLHKKRAGLFGGCTGFGCGAAFNFIALLPDGEVHACRKFSSLIGNLKDQSIDQVYCSESAERYRERLPGCRDCPLCHVCGGCLAVVNGFGPDERPDRDPYCFLEVNGVAVSRDALV